MKNLDDFFDMIFGEDAIMDWKEEYKDPFLRKIHESRGFKEKTDEAIIRLVDLSMFMYYSLRRYFA